MQKENLIIVFFIVSIFVFFILIGCIIFSFVPDEIKHEKCIRTELRDSNFYCVMEDD